MVFRLSSDYRKMLENAFDKHPPWYDLIISSPMKNNPLHKFFQKRLSSYLPLKDPPMKRSIKKRSTHTSRGDIMPFLQCKIIWEYVHPYLRGSGLKLINILELAKVRIE